MQRPDLDQQRRSGLSDPPERRTDAVDRSAQSIDMPLHDKLAEQVMKMRYLSRLRAFLVPALDS